MSQPLLRVDELCIAYRGRRVVHDVSLAVNEGEVLALVGESGSGKSTIASALMGMLPKGGAIEQGSITFGKYDLAQLTPKEFRALRTREIAMIFQNPMSSLNPYMKVGKQVTEALVLHTDLGVSASRKRVEQLFEEVQIREPGHVMKQYPHQLSGGMKQRVMAAMAVSCNPKLLIADEPTTALDVTVQKKFLELLGGLVERYRMGMVFISHDLGVVSEISNRVHILRHGRTVETGTTDVVLAQPSAAYTEQLITAIPRVDGPPQERLGLVEGTMHT